MERREERRWRKKKENGDRDREAKEGGRMVAVEEACVPNDVCTPRHVNDISGG